MKRGRASMASPTARELLGARARAGLAAAAVSSALAEPTACVRWVFPILAKTISEANRSRVASMRARLIQASRAKTQRSQARLVTRHELEEGASWPKGVLALEVKLTRHAPSKGLDDDNLRSAFKAIRDGIADALRIDDGDRRIRFAYDQKRAPAGVYFVLVEIRALTDAPPCIP